MKKLDFDFLERAVGNVGDPETSSSIHEEESSTIDCVKCVFLGAPGVGKSSIIEQYLKTDFSEKYIPTESKEVHIAHVVYGMKMYQLRITDLPKIPFFPVNSDVEWTDYRGYGLRSASAYILVFDLSDLDTFQYLRTMREQILEARDIRNVPLIVVGNKLDKIPENTPQSTKHRDIVNLVKKHWRCAYVECTAKHNSRIVQVFFELIKGIHAIEGISPSPTATSALPTDSPLDDDKCIIL